MAVVNGIAMEQLNNNSQCDLVIIILSLKRTAIICDCHDLTVFTSLAIIYYIDLN